MSDLFGQFWQFVANICFFLLLFALTYLVTIPGCSFLEWIIHKHFMHGAWLKKITLFGGVLARPYDKHGNWHHKERKAPGKFFAKADELKKYHAFETSAMPFVYLGFLPIYVTISFAVTLRLGLGAGIGTFCGIALGTATYLIAYEILHWSMHCPEKFLFKDSHWFHFLTEHHRLHHKWSKINYNVVLPLADLVFRTYDHEKILEPEPEQTLTVTEARP